MIDFMSLCSGASLDLKDHKQHWPHLLEYSLTSHVFVVDPYTSDEIERHLWSDRLAVRVKFLQEVSQMNRIVWSIFN